LQRAQNKPELQDVGSDTCSYSVDNSFYNLLALKLTDGYYSSSGFKDFPNRKIVFNFCEPFKPLDTNCDDNTIAALIDLNEPSGTVCYKYSSSAKDVKGYFDRDRPYSAIGVSGDIMESDMSKGRLSLKYPNVSNSQNPFNQSSSLYISMICDPNAEKPEVSNSTFDSNHDVFLLVRSKHACYVFSINPLVRFMGDQPVILGCSLIVFGLVLGILGKRFFKISLFIVGTTVLTLASTLFVFTAFMSRDSSDVTGWIIFSVCLVVSMIGGLLLAKFFRFGVAVAAGWGGVVLALILYNSFVYKIDGTNKVVFWIFVVLMAVVFAALSFKFCWPAVIIATSIAGAYSFIRGISVMAGGYPSELEIIKLIESKEYGGMPGSFYGYMAGFFILAITFMVWQFKRYGVESETDKDGQRKVVHHYHKIGGKKTYTWRK